MMQPAVRFSPDVETPAPDKTQVIRDLSDTLHDIMETTSRDYGHAVRMRVGDAVWNLRVQLCRDLDKMPVEDPSVLWDETLSPFVTVARLHALAQPGWSKDAAELVDDHMRFSVWTRIEAHRPLGAINRARQEPYRMSSHFRADFNGCPIHEPASHEAMT